MDYQFPIPKVHREPTQPALRFVRSDHAPLEGDARMIDEGVSFVAKTILVELQITQAGNFDFLQLPAGTYVDRVIGRIMTPLDGAGTVELGTVANADEFIDTVDWDETLQDATATNRGSANANSPNGIFFAAATTLRITVGGAPTVGYVQFIISGWEMDEMHNWMGAHIRSTL